MNANRPRMRALLTGMMAGQLFVGQTLAAEAAGVVRYGGLPLPGATVSAAGAQGPVKKTVTDGDGKYTFTDIAEGLYTFEASMLLFAPQKKELKTGENGEFDLVLLPPDQISAAVVAPEPGVVTTTTTAPRTANGRPVPPPKSGQAQTNTASAFQRTQLNSAGAQQQGDGLAGQDVAELRQKAEDGLLVNGSVNNGAASPFAQFPAFGNNRRGLRSLYNGNIGMIVRNSAFDARNYSLTGQDTPKPAYNLLQGVAAFGGPVRIPKLLTRNGPQFTVNYQWTRNKNATIATGLMPTDAQRNGILADRVIPQSQISAQARALLQLYPLPNFTGNSRYNYQVPLVNGQHMDDLQARMNRGIGRRDSLQGSFAYQSSRTDNTNIFGFLDTGRSRGLNTNVAWRHSFSPRFFTNFTGTFSRQSSANQPFFANRFNIAGAAGILGGSTDPLFWGPPSLTFASGISGLNNQIYSSNRNQTSGIAVDWFTARGRHNWTGGGGIRRQQVNIFSQQDPRGSFTFTGLGNASGSDLGNFLTGQPDASSIAFGNADKYLRATLGELWVQDDWRVNPGLTLNLGARWEYWGPTSERQGRLVNLRIGQGFTTAVPEVSGSPMKADRNNIAPRLSLSWRPLAASSMVVRAGYGIYYDTSVYLPIAMQMAQQAPLSKSLRIEQSVANPITLANGFSSPGTTTPTTFAVDPNFRLGYSQAWNVSLQRDLPWAMQMLATYSGAKGTGAQQQILPNTFPTGAVNPCPNCPTGYTYLMSNGNSIRNAAQIQLRRRLRAGFTSQVQYTLAKSMDNAILTNGGATGGRGTGAGGYIAQNWLDTSAERGRSVFDQRHNLAVTVQYTTGMGLRSGLANNWKGKALRDWTFSTQLNTGTGLPLNPVFLAAARGTGVTGTIRPDMTGADVYAAPEGFHLNPAAFKAPAAGQWGNAPRNSITGPNQFSMNAAMNRSFQAHDRVNIDFRADVTNVLNTVVFPNWVATVNSAQFGLPTNANAMRSVQASIRARF